MGLARWSGRGRPQGGRGGQVGAGGEGWVLPPIAPEPPRPPVAHRSPPSGVEMSPTELSVWTLSYKFSVETSALNLGFSEKQLSAVQP